MQRVRDNGRGSSSGRSKEAGTTQYTLMPTNTTTSVEFFRKRKPIRFQIRIRSISSSVISSLVRS